MHYMYIENVLKGDFGLTLRTFQSKWSEVTVISAIWYPFPFSIHFFQVLYIIGLRVSDYLYHFPEMVFQYLHGTSLHQMLVIQTHVDENFINTLKKRMQHVFSYTV